MKLLFVVTGIGLGHATRVDSVISEIKKRDKNAKICIAGYKSSLDYFKNSGFRKINLNGVDYSSENFKISILNILRKNLNFPINFRRDIRLLMENIEEFNPDYVIVDWELSGLVAASRSNKKVVLIFNYDPYMFDSFIKKFKLNRFKILQRRFVESIYNLANKRAEAIFIPGLKNKKENKFHFINFIVRKNPDELEDEDILMKKLGLAKKPILIMLGGSNFGYDLLDKMKSVLYELPNQEFIIFGYDRDFSNKNIKSYKFKENYLEYLKTSKGVIMLAGHSSFAECAVFKKPCLVFPIRGQVEQMLNAYTIESTKIGLVKYLKNIKKETIKEDIEEFIKKIDELQKRANNLNIKADGASKIAEFLIKRHQNGRD